MVYEVDLHVSIPLKEVRETITVRIEAENREELFYLVKNGVTVSSSNWKEVNDGNTETE